MSRHTAEVMAQASALQCDPDLIAWAHEHDVDPSLAKYVRDSAADFARSAANWQTSCDEYAGPRAKALYDAWLASLMAQFHRQATAEFAEAKPPPQPAGFFETRFRGERPRNYPWTEHELAGLAARVDAAVRAHALLAPATK